MSIKKVTATINGSNYKLSSSGDNNYSTDIESPQKAAEYDIAISATDEAGNVTSINSDDKRLGNSLKLKTVNSLETADLRYIILTSELGNQMLDTVAPIYDQSKLTLYTFESFAETLEKETAFIKGDFISQMFPQTVTWGISLWEGEYGITPDVSKTLEQRRQYLMGAMYKHSPITPRRIKDIVYAVTGITSDVEEHTAPNTVTISLQGYVSNLNPLKSELDAKLPAHLNYVIYMADRMDIDVSTYSGFGVHVLEKVKVEVTN